MTSTKRKTILILMDWYWPGFKAGGPVRSVVNLVDQLSGTFNFKIITRNTDYTSEEPYDSVESNVWIQQNEHLELYYISSDQLTALRMRSLIKDTQHDVMYLNSLFSLYFSIWPLMFKQQRTVLAVRGMLGQAAFALKQKKKKGFLKIAKLLGLFKGVVFQATTPQEKEDILSVFPTNDVLIAPNLASKVIYKEQGPDVVKTQGELRLFYLGRIAPEKNPLYAIRLLNEISNHTISLDLYGAIYDPAYFEECERAISESPTNISIQYKGLIEPTALTAALTDYHGLLFPTTGENFGHAIIEALLHAKPVLISDQTPWKTSKAIFAESLSNQAAFKAIINSWAQMDQTAYNTLAQTALNEGNAFIKQQQDLSPFIHLFES